MKKDKTKTKKSRDKTVKSRWRDNPRIRASPQKFQINR